jgi:hypothetical protein
MMGFVGLFERLLFMSCRSFIRLASAKHERPLGMVERIRHAMHKIICRICRAQERHMDQLHALANSLGHHAMDESDAELSPEAMGRIRQAVAQAATRLDTHGGPKA